MNDPHEIEFHHDVAGDLSRLPRNLAARILRAVEERLGRQPHIYGKRLGKSLRGYWKLRVGDYRVVFELVGKAVRIYGVMHRRDVYIRIVSRLAHGWNRGSPS